MSDLLLILSLLMFFLAVGISRSVFDGKKPKDQKGKPAQDPATQRQLRISWVLAGVGGVLLLISRVMDQ